jgi:type I restriction enzyme S subunit
MFCYVDITSVDNICKRIVSTKTLLGSDAPSRARQVILAGDVIVSTTRPNLNAVATVPAELDGQICSTGFCVLRANSDVDRDYLFAYVQTEEFVQSLSRLVKGALYPAVTDKHVRAQLIPLPPPSEQKRIAAILNEQMVGVERARAAAEAELELSASLIEAYLRQSLSNGNVRRIPLRECLQEVSSGVGAAWRNYPVMGATRDGIAPAKEAVGKNPERYKLVEPGTIFYNPMRILIGSIAMIDEEEEPGITSPDYVVIKTVDGVLHPRWFYYWLRSSYGQTFIKSLARGAVRERMLFRRLVSAEINVPSWEGQVNVAEKLKSVVKLKRSVGEQLDTMNKLPATLLREAFSGEL